MKVQSITNYYSAKPYCMKKQNTSRENVSFGHSGLWDQLKLDILKRSDTEMYELAKYFYNSSESELRDVSTIRNFFGFKNEKKSEKAYQRLKQAVETAIENKNSLDLLFKFLNTKQKDGPLMKIEQDSLANVTNKINEIESKFASRKEEFYHEDNNLSESDIDYFKRYDNDY